MSCDNGSYSFLMSIYEKTKASELSRSIDCMLGQTVPPSEIVIVKDGGLPPALDKLLADYALKHPNVIKSWATQATKDFGTHCAWVSESALMNW